MSADANSWELQLLIEQTEGLAIEGREAVLAAKRGNPASTASELRIAAVLSAHGLRVRMLLDQDASALTSSERRRGGFSLPDLRVYDPSQDFEFLVEVRRINSGTVAFHSRLGPALFDAGLLFRIHDEPLGAAIWTPGTDYASRARQEHLADELVARVIGELKCAELQGRRSGYIEIQMPISPEHPQPGDNFHRFRFKQLERDVTPEEVRAGILSGSGYTAIRWLGGSKYGEFALRAVLEKVEAQRKHPSKLQGLPYVVAIDSHEFDVDPVQVSAPLVRGLLYVGRGVHYREWPRGSLRALEGTPWACLGPLWEVRETDMVCNVWRDGSVVEEDLPRPQFMDDWARTLSALLVRHQTRDVMQWIVNPWAIDSYNEPRLMNLGFHLRPEGREERR